MSHLRLHQPSLCTAQHLNLVSLTHPTDIYLQSALVVALNQVQVECPMYRLLLMLLLFNL